MSLNNEEPINCLLNMFPKQKKPDFLLDLLKKVHPSFNFWEMAKENFLSSKKKTLTAIFLGHFLLL